ncbi:MAG: F510_1955 family glycosylhydrolase [Actinomycetota bacterium]
MYRSSRSLILPLVAVVALLAACGSGTDTGTANGGGGSVASGALPGEHVHGVARDPGDGKVYLATHQGLFRYDEAGPVRVGPVVDFMGFAVAGPGRFYASGHPGDGVDLPAPVGLMETLDAGNTWSVRSRGGESDFHALTASSKGVLAFDGALQSSTDGKTWSPLTIGVEPASLAAAPDGSRILAMTASGVMFSGDQGATWAPLPGAPKLLLAAWADNATAMGVTSTGALAVSTDAGATWTTAAGTVDSVQAMCATRASDGTVEVLVVTDSAIVRTVDSGATFSPLGVN